MTQPPVALEPYPWRRLDPRMLLVHPVTELIRFLPLLVGIVVLGSTRGSWWQLTGIAIPIVLGVLQFLTTRYRITPTQIELERGLIGKKVSTARLDRVRAVEVTASPMHRVLGLAKVEIGTASGGTQGVDKFALNGLALPQARELRVSLLHRADDDRVPAPPDALTPGVDLTGDAPSREAVPQAAYAEDEVLLDFDKRWVRYAPLTSSGNVIAAGLMAVLGQFFDSVGDRFFADVDVLGWLADRPVETLVPLVTVGLVVAFLILGAVFSVAGYLITNWGFTLSRDSRGRTFRVRRGLLTTTEVSLERERLRGLEVLEPLGLRLVGAGRLAAIVTGVSRDESSSSQLVPPAPREVIDATGEAVLGHCDPLHVPLVPHGPLARRRRYTRALAGSAVVPAVVLGLVLLSAFPWWVLLPALLALPVGVALAADRSRRLGHALSGDHLVVRSGSLRGRRDVLQRSGIIGWNVQQSWFQRRAGLATLVATTAAGRQEYAAIDIPESMAIGFADEAVPGLVTQFLA